LNSNYGIKFIIYSSLFKFLQIMKFEFILIEFELKHYKKRNHTVPLGQAHGDFNPGLAKGRLRFGLVAQVAKQGSCGQGIAARWVIPTAGGAGC
jgi:hypothetical protein